MNERLRELMLEAGYAAPEIAGRATKLVDLIVRECAEIARVYSEEGVEFGGGDAIKEHFGVEE